MTQGDDASSKYPCMAPKPGLRRVDEPRDERPATPSLLRETVTRLIVALRR